MLTKNNIFYLSLGLIFLFIWMFFPGYAVVLFLLFLILFFAYFLEWGLYVFLILSAFHGFTLVFGNYEWAKHLPYLPAINAPVGDFFGVLLLFSFLIYLFFTFSRENFILIFNFFKKTFWYFLFLIVALVSLLFVFDHNVSEGLKYFVRWPLFAYLVFLFLPFAIIKNQNVLNKIIKLWFWLGVGFALYGLGAIFNSSGEWWRISPYPIFGFTPLVLNHNALAELLTPIVPLGLWLAWQAKNVLHKSANFYLFFTGLILAVALLTLSRSAWLGLLGEAIVLLYFFRAQLAPLWKRASWQKNIFFVSFIGVFVLIYMGAFVLFSPASLSSTSARLDTIKVASWYFSRSPVIGYGVGSFVPLLNSTKAYIIEYGEPLESHGFIQKIMVEEGLLGLFFFLGFLVVLFRQFFLLAKKHNSLTPMPVFLLAFALGAVMFQIFDTSYFSYAMWLPLGIVLASTKFNYAE